MEKQKKSLGGENEVKNDKSKQNIQSNVKKEK